MTGKTHFMYVSMAAIALVTMTAVGVTSSETNKTTTSTVGDETKPDNSAVNQRDRRADEITAQQQGINAPDAELTATIRKALVNDSLLSTYAHNVKIVAANGAVTLKGPVRSAAEKTRVERIASQAAGAGHVINQLEVAPKKATR